MKAMRISILALCIVILSASIAFNAKKHPIMWFAALTGAMGATAQALPSSSENDFRHANFPIFSKYFTGRDNPFHMTVGALVLRGARLQSRDLVQNLWSQGYYNEDPLNYPLYRTDTKNRKIPIRCAFWGNCNTQGYALHVPAGASQEEKGDHHITIVDVAQGVEFDGWGGASGYGGGPCSVGDLINCSWGGFYAFAGKGLTNNGQEGDHAGYALGLFTITAQELLQGHIDHALGMNADCLDNPTVYPADTFNKSDHTCSNGSAAQTAPSYGMMVHLRKTFDVSGSGYSRPCKTILTALQTYGAYLYDTGNRGLFIAIEHPMTYGDPNPWYTKIFPEMAASGDASGQGTSWGYASCLNRMSADDIEIFTVPNLGY